MLYWSIEYTAFARKVITTVRADYIFIFQVCFKAALLKIFNNSLLSFTVDILTVATKTVSEKIIISFSLVEPDDKSPDPRSSYSTVMAASRLCVWLFINLYCTTVVNPGISMVYGRASPISVGGPLPSNN